MLGHEYLRYKARRVVGSSKLYFFSEIISVSSHRMTYACVCVSVSVCADHNSYKSLARVYTREYLYIGLFPNGYIRECIYGAILYNFIIFFDARQFLVR